MEMEEAKNVNQHCEIRVYKPTILSLALGYAGIMLQIVWVTIRKSTGRAAYICSPSMELMIMAAAVATQCGLMFLLMQTFQK